MGEQLSLFASKPEGPDLDLRRLNHIAGLLDVRPLTFSCKVNEQERKELQKRFWDRLKAKVDALIKDWEKALWENTFEPWMEPDLFYFYFEDE